MLRSPPSAWSQVSDSPLLRGLLHIYGLQLHHLAPNSILHIACFVMVCEAFLCCEPHLRLWCKYFCVKLHTNNSETHECGGASISKIPVLDI